MNQQVTEIKVGLNFGVKAQALGRLAIRDHIIYFAFDEDFVQSGLEISPRHLPVRAGVMALPARPFEGLAGVFNDSLPDGWGRLLFDRMMRAQGQLPTTLSPLDRLAYVGLDGMGALVYEPDLSPEDSQVPINLDELADSAAAVLEGSVEEVLSELLALNGSSAGARPKALIGVNQSRSRVIHGAHYLNDDFEHWLVKFSNTQDGTDAGAIEYVYALMAKEAGVTIPDIHLFPAHKGSGYFAVKRFDRKGAERFHMHTASGLLHSDFRTPSLDYEDLLNLTGALTKNIREVEKMYRLAVFNVLSHNRDDHGKNFSFLMDKTGTWTLAPAYDLTFSSGPGGEQSTMVAGEGRNPSVAHLVKLGALTALPKALIKDIIEQTMLALHLWESLAKKHKVARANVKLIGAAMTRK